MDIGSMIDNVTAKCRRRNTGCDHGGRDCTDTGSRDAGMVKNDAICTVINSTGEPKCAETIRGSGIQRTVAHLKPQEAGTKIQQIRCAHQRRLGDSARRKYTIIIGASRSRNAIMHRKDERIASITKRVYGTPRYNRRAGCMNKRCYSYIDGWGYPDSNRKEPSQQVLSRMTVVMIERTKGEPGAYDGAHRRPVRGNIPKDAHTDRSVDSMNLTSDKPTISEGEICSKMKEQVAAIEKGYIAGSSLDGSMPTTMPMREYQKRADCGFIVLLNEILERYEPLPADKLFTLETGGFSKSMPLIHSLQRP